MATPVASAANSISQQFLCKSRTIGRHGYGLWVFLETKRTVGLLGRGGLRNVYVGGNEWRSTTCAEPNDWGKGRDGPVLRVGFQQLGLQDVVWFYLTTNLHAARL